MRVAGVSVNSGDLYFAVVEPSGAGLIAQHVDVGAPRLRPASALPADRRAADLLGRVKQELRALEVKKLGVLDVRMFNSWKYSAAYSRISALTVLQLACHDLGIPYQEVKTDPVGRVVGVAANHLDSLDPARFGFNESPLYWRIGRSGAFAVAATVLDEESA
ncbi:hypothetical protein [Micromonospora sp. DT227]|uniref:hypothetical protein n=1 Tax=Micromonospora sp. DT227 TaxID=3393433 RepID=UPI003CFAF2FF